MKRFISLFILFNIIYAVSLAGQADNLKQSSGASQKKDECTAEPQLKSTAGPEPVEIMIKNYLAAPIQVYWLNFEGRRVFYFALGPKQYYVQKTYQGHVWVLTSKSGDCLQIVKADKNVVATVRPQGPNPAPSTRAENPDKGLDRRRTTEPPDKGHVELPGTSLAESQWFCQQWSAQLNFGSQGKGAAYLSGDQYPFTYSNSGNDITIDALVMGRPTKVLGKVNGDRMVVAINDPVFGSTTLEFARMHNGK